MAKLNAAKRNNLPKSDFAGPNRSYPINDKAHARNAKARASQQYNAGNLSASAKAKIDAKANAKLGVGSASSHASAAHSAFSGNSTRTGAHS